MRSKYFDSFIVLIQLVVLVYSGYKLFFDAGAESIRAGGQIGAIHQLNETVKKRSRSILTWSNATLNEGIYNGDRVYTHKGAQVAISFSDGTQLILKENALVKIDKSESRPLSLEVKRGGVVVETSNELTLTIGSIKVNSSKGKINLDKGHIDLIDGNAIIADGKQLRELTPNSSAQFGPQGEIRAVKKLKVRLESPSLGKKVYDYEPVLFEWKLLSKLQRFKIVLADNNEFINARSFEISSPGDQSFKQSLSAGSYYWKLVSYDGEDLGVVESFFVAESHAPVIISPLNNQKYIVNEFSEGPAEKSITFEWKACQVNEYYLELKGTKPIKSFSTKAIMEKLLPGNHSFRVGAAYGNKVIWSEWYSFVIKINPLPVAPKLNLASKFYSRVVNLNWKFSPALSYRLKVIDPQQRELLLNLEEVNHYRFKFSSYGHFCVSLVAIDHLERESAEGEKSCFDLIPQAPQIDLEKHQYFLDDQFQGVPLYFIHPDSEKIHLQVAGDSSFSNKVFEKEFKSKNFLLPMQKPGQYFLRAKTISNGIESPFSKVMKVKLKSLPQLKAPDLPTEEVFELSRIKHSKHWWEFLLASAYADNFKSIIKWKEIELAQEYFLEIYTDPHGKNKLLEVSTKGPLYRWEDVQPGQYYWRLSYKDRFGRVSPKSRLVKMIIKPSAKWIRAMKEAKKSRPWQVDFSLAPTIVDYQLSNYLFDIDISGLTLSSFRSEIKYSFASHFKAENRFSFMSGSVLDATLLSLDESFLVSYQMKFARNWDLHLSGGARLLKISHSFPIDKTLITPTIASDLYYGPHRFGLQFGLSFFDIKYQYRLKWNSGYFVQLGLGYRFESYSYDVYEVKVSALQLLLGGGIRF